MSVEVYKHDLKTWIANGQVFSASMGVLNSGAGTNNYPLSVFNPGINKDILILRAQISNGSGGMTGFLQLVTTNPAFGTQVTPVNHRAGGASSGLPASAVTMASANQAIAGPYQQVVTIASSTYEMLENGEAILLPSGGNNGAVVYIQTFGAGINSALIMWAEL